MEEKEIRAIIRESLNQLFERRMVTYAFEISSKIGREIEGMEKTLDIQAMGDGAIGLYRYKDGNAYEIQIRPISLSKDKGRWGNLIQKAEPHPMKAWYKMLNPGQK